jgi:protein involved in polysaccharide export with SLBB domain
MGKAATVGRTSVALTLLLVGMAGCGLTPGGRTAFPEPHRLLATARNIRDTAPEVPPVPRELAKHPLPPYIVEPGDVLLVQPSDLDSPARMPGDQPVLPDGTINLGRYGKPVVAGKTVDEIEALVRALIEAQTPNAGPITVRLVLRQSKVFYVLGEVNAPGVYQLTGRETVLDAILIAGGLTDRASRRNIILSRPTRPDDCRVVLPVCYEQIVQLGDTTTNYQIAPGDRIWVPTRNCWDEIRAYRWPCLSCCRPQFPCCAACGPGPDEPR